MIALQLFLHTGSRELACLAMGVPAEDVADVQASIDHLHRENTKPCYTGTANGVAEPYAVRSAIKTFLCPLAT